MFGVEARDLRGLDPRPFPQLYSILLSLRSMRSLANSTSIAIPLLITRYIPFYIPLSSSTSHSFLPLPLPLFDPADLPPKSARLQGIIAVSDPTLSQISQTNTY